jgi:hypothetical protein
VLCVSAKYQIRCLCLGDLPTSVLVPTVAEVGQYGDKKPLENGWRIPFTPHGNIRYQNANFARPKYDKYFYLSYLKCFLHFSVQPIFGWNRLTQGDLPTPPFETYSSVSARYGARRPLAASAQIASEAFWAGFWYYPRLRLKLDFWV